MFLSNAICILAQARNARHQAIPSSGVHSGSQKEDVLFCVGIAETNLSSPPSSQPSSVLSETHLAQKSNIGISL